MAERDEMLLTGMCLLDDMLAKRLSKYSIRMSH